MPAQPVRLDSHVTAALVLEASALSPRALWLDSMRAVNTFESPLYVPGRLGLLPVPGWNPAQEAALKAAPPSDTGDAGASATQ